MDSKNFAVLEDLNVDCNTKNTIIKRVSFIYTIENFPISEGYSSVCGLYNYKTGERCLYGQKCQKCRERDHILDEGHVSKFEMNFNVLCFLIIDPIGCFNIESGDEYVSLHLKFTGFNRMKIVALCKFSILNMNGKDEYKSVVGIEKFNAYNNSYCLETFINRDDLRKRKNMLLPNNRLTVCFEMFYILDYDIDCFGISENIPIDEHLSVLSSDMKIMLDSPEFYDCIIKVGDSEIGAHKCILASRSENFREMLKNKSSVCKSDVIEINDFRLEVVKEMVNYLYTGRSPRVDEIAIEMLEIAEKYKLEGLKLIATESLFKSLNVENVCDYLEKSELCSAENLKEFCIRYIYLNAEEVVKSEKWRRIFNLYPLLVARIFNVAVHID
uniref:Speckle-type POZ protein (inferred by orthology to a human protein) n=1 Tax=Strongyloides venezuelensis TaxID=75913 RepID=A0A0K0FI15_STRVS